MLIDARRNEKALCIWSSAVSAGQEAYSIAMLLREFFPELHDWNILIQATDISEGILEKAKAGIYSPSEVKRGLDQRYLQKYFHQLEGGYQIDSTIRSMVNFLPHNLVAMWPFYPKFDLIMLRNVLIYFNQNVKDRVLEKIHRQLNGSDGVLLLGASESIYMNNLFKIISLEKISYYQAS